MRSGGGSRQNKMTMMKSESSGHKQKVKVKRSINNKPLTSAPLTCRGITMQDY